MRKYRYIKIREGLVGHWRPSRGPTGNLLIDSIRGNHGTLTNGPTWVASGGVGASGYALSFDGVNDSVSASSPMPLGNMTMLTWFNPTLTSTLVYLAGVQNSGLDGYRALRITSGNALEFGAIGSATRLAVSSTLTNSQWAFGVGVLDAQNISVFLNGRSAGVTALSGATFGVSLSNFTISKRPDAASNFYTGLVDEVAVFNRALTASEILSLYNAGRGALDQRVKKIIVRGVTLAPSSFKAAWTLGSNLVLGI